MLVLFWSNTLTKKLPPNQSTKEQVKCCNVTAYSKMAACLGERFLFFRNCAADDESPLTNQRHVFGIAEVVLKCQPRQQNYQVENREKWVAARRADTRQWKRGISHLSRRENELSLSIWTSSAPGESRGPDSPSLTESTWSGLALRQWIYDIKMETWGVTHMPQGVRSE